MGEPGLRLMSGKEAPAGSSFLQRAAYVFMSHAQGGSFISETTGFPTEIVFLLVKIQIRSGPGTQNVPIQPWFPKKKSVF